MNWGASAANTKLTVAPVFQAQKNTESEPETSQWK